MNRVKYNDFTKYLKYIGITTKKDIEEIYCTYKYCFDNKKRSSILGIIIEKLGYEDAASEEIIRFISCLDYQEEMIREVEKYCKKGVWGKCLGKC